MSISVHERQNCKKGYQVRVMRHGKLYTKYFTGKRRAENYERELLESLPEIKSQKGVPKATKPPNTGVKRIVKRKFQRAGRNPVHVFTVYWRTPEGAPRYTNISIDHWGEAKAWRLAKQKKREKDAVYLADAETKPAKKRPAAKKVVAKPAKKKKAAPKKQAKKKAAPKKRVKKKATPKKRVKKKAAPKKRVKKTSRRAS